MSEPADPDATAPDQERHASWAELFFDLVVVAGASTLAHVVAGHPDGRAIGLYAVLFLAFWLAWTTFMIYGNIAADRTLVVRLLGGMFGLGVMAASVPGVGHALLEEGSHGSTALNVFVVAYVVTRLLGSQSWRRGEVVLDFPVVQHTAGTLPWLASLWVHDDTWKVALWAAGVAIDLLMMLAVSGDEMVERYQERFDQVARRRRRGGRPSPRGRDERTVSITGVSVDVAHLAERLGLFVIIVLGEGVVQVVDAASEAEVGWDLLGAGFASFVLLAGMFGLSVLFGHAGVPHLRGGSLPVRVVLVLHLLVTAVLACVAVGLAAVVEHGTEPLDDSSRWLLCGAVAAYFAIGLFASVVARGWRPVGIVVWVLTGLGVPLVLGARATEVGGTALVAYVVLVVLGHLAAELRAERAADPHAA